MISETPAQSISSDAPGAATAASPSRLGTLLLGCALLLLWGMLCRFLGIEWSINEQYNYGWFVPFFALYLFWTRWESRPARTPSLAGNAPSLTLFIALVALFLLLPLRLFEVANPDWRLLGWVHTIVAAALTFVLLWCIGGPRWVRHFAFPICFFFVAVPWLLVIETPIVQGLMRLAAAAATEAAGLCGIPAQLEGNLIRVNTGVVGVNEACSGVRSLQTSLMIGLLFGGLSSLSSRRRVWLVVGALLIALVGNFGRAFFLVWVAAGDSPAAVDRWHDVAGYTILGAVFLGTLALLRLLARGQRKPASDTPAGSQATIEQPPQPLLLPGKTIAFALCWLLLVEAGVEVWYRSHERNLVTQARWSAQWPGPDLHGQRLPIDERVKRILSFDEGGQASLSLPGTSSPRAVGLLFFFRWEPGSTSILRARGHRPDICLPSSGWKATGDRGLRFYRAGGNLSLPFRHYTFKREMPGEASAFTDAFFCIQEDRVRATAPGVSNADPTVSLVTPSMLRERIAVVADGLRNPGQQVLELVLISQEEKSTAAVEATFAELLPSLVHVEEAPQLAVTR